MGARGGRRGLTLIEVLVSLAIFSLMVVALLTLYTSGQRQFINGSLHSDVLEDSRYPLAWIGPDVRVATQVAASWGSYTTSSSELVLQVPSVSADGLIIDAEQDSDYIIYRLTGDSLERIVDAKDGVSARTDETRRLAAGISALSFTYYAYSGVQLTSDFQLATSVKMSVTAVATGFQRTFQESLNSRFKLRNK
jgi:prepilin-type N-terminal cleavage/methylation domain-containing protein